MSFPTAPIWALVGLCLGAPLCVAAETTSSTTTLALSEALSRALASNPRLRAQQLTLTAADGARTQAGLWSNPTLDYDRENLGNSRLQGGDGPTTQLALAQLIELGGKRSARQAIAEHAHQAAGEEVTLALASVTASTTERFAQVLVAQEQLRLSDELQLIAEKTAQTVAAKVKAGKVMPIEASKGELALMDARLRKAKAERDLSSARTRLAQSWGAVVPDFVQVVGQFEELPELPSEAVLRERLRRSPLLRRETARVAERAAELSLARAKAMPDLTLSAGVRRYEALGEEAYVIGVSVPLPLFDRNQGERVAAEARAEAASYEQRLAETEAYASLSQAYQGLAQAQQEVQFLKAQVLPSAESVYGVARTAYEAGKFSLLDVLDAQRTLFDAKSRYLTALQTFHSHVATLEALIGGPLNTSKGS